MGPDNYNMHCRSFLHIGNFIKNCSFEKGSKNHTPFLIVIIFIYIFYYNVIISLYIFIHTSKCQ